jgi:hypothetical protein
MNTNPRNVTLEFEASNQRIKSFNVKEKQLIKKAPTIFHLLFHHHLI